VLDDPKLLRKSIKRDQKGKAKSAEQWAERQRKQEEEKKARQLKRFQNIAKKKQAKKAAKMDKRERKLARPGFEGRKKGAVNS